MAGVTDLRFANSVANWVPAWWSTKWSPGLCLVIKKSKLRIQFADEPAPRSVQIASYDPQMMAEAARFNVQQGAQIIDIRMFPAKKFSREPPVLHCCSTRIWCRIFSMRWWKASMRH